jgi:hypothetical protein
MKAMEPKHESSIGKAATNISAKILITFIPFNKGTTIAIQRREEIKVEHLVLSYIVKISIKSIAHMKPKNIKSHRHILFWH